jgi:RHS repeat-associated protein
VLRSTGSVSNPFRYTGREFDTETSLYFYRARYFDPTTGRFVAEDPSGTSGGLNLFEYVANNSTNLYDPTGLQGTKPKTPKPPSSAVFYLCCDGGNLRVCDQGSSGQSGWVLDCMRKHEATHVKDLCANGANPCKNQPNGPLTVSMAQKSQLECSAYRAELECLKPAPLTKELAARRKYIQTQITAYCGSQ